MVQRRLAGDSIVRERLSAEAASELRAVPGPGGRQEGRGERKSQAGRTRAKVLRREQAWLTQETARGDSEVRARLPSITVQKADWTRGPRCTVLQRGNQLAQRAQAP